MASGKRRIGMLGLSFKAGTDDLRESPLVTVAERLIGKGYVLKIYDPEVNLSRLLGANKRYIEQTIPHIGGMMSTSVAEVLDHGEVIVVGLINKEIEAALGNGAGRTLIDLSGLRAAAGGDGYQGVCW
jgi:GDP-mannose 6-dehydrogenase